MVLSLMTFVYVFSTAVVFLIILTIKLYVETSKYSTELQNIINKKTIAVNTATAKWSVAQSKYDKLLLEQTSKAENEKTEQQKIDQSDEYKSQIEKLSAELKTTKDEVNFLKNYEAEFVKQNNENLMALEQLEKTNKDLSRQLKEEQSRHTESTQVINQEQLLKMAQLQKQINNFEKTIQIKEESVQALLTEKNTLVQNLQNYMIEIQDLKMKLNLSQTQWSTPLQVSGVVDEEEFRKLQDDLQLRIEFEKKLKSRVLKAHSIILTLEKRNISLKNQCKKLTAQVEEKKSNVIPFTQKTNSGELSFGNELEIRVHNIYQAIKEGESVGSSVHFDELQTLKAKLDEARKNLFEIQNTKKISDNLRVKNVA